MGAMISSIEQTRRRRRLNQRIRELIAVRRAFGRTVPGPGQPTLPPTEPKTAAAA